MSKTTVWIQRCINEYSVYFRDANTKNQVIQQFSIHRSKHHINNDYKKFDINDKKIGKPFKIEFDFPTNINSALAQGYASWSINFSKDDFAIIFNCFPKYIQKEMRGNQMKTVWIQKLIENGEEIFSIHKTKKQIESDLENYTHLEISGTPFKLQIPNSIYNNYINDDINNANNNFDLSVNLDEDELDEIKSILNDLEDKVPTESEKESSRKVKIKKQAKGAGKAVGQALSLIAIEQSGDLILGLARQYSKKVPWLESMLETEQGREVIKLVGAVLLQTVSYQTNLVPKSEIVAKVAELQITCSSKKLIEPHISEVVQFILTIANIGESLEKGDIAALASVNNEIISPISNKEFMIAK